MRVRIAFDEKSQFQNASKITQEQFYTYDLLAGSDSINSTKILNKEIFDHMTSGGFELRKWITTYSEVLSELPKKINSHLPYPFIRRQSVTKNRRSLLEFYIRYIPN